MALIQFQAHATEDWLSWSCCSSSSGGYSLRKMLALKPSRKNLLLKPKSSLVCKASWQELAGVLVFSAIPFTAVKAIANSPLGELLQNRMLKTKKAALRDSSKFEALARQARNESLWYGEERPRWLGPIPYDYPSYLTGELPGDYGFDVAGLSKDPMAFQKYFNFEILHARWAMLGALGALVPEVLDVVGAFHFVEPVWWRVGYSKLQGETLEYLGIPGLHLAGSQGVIVIAICQALLMVGPEYARYCGIEALEPLGIFLPGDINYPGGALFDPLNLSKDPVAFEELKVKEIKHGRLAMVAWLGFYIQAAFTGKGPVQNLLDHISDPLHNNLLSMVGPEYARYCGIEALEPLGIFLPGNINYPGGALFDPLNLSKDPVAFEELKVKEIKNGRLAMVAWLGFYIQAAFTGKGPVQNLLDHISDPLHNNLLSMFKSM